MKTHQLERCRRTQDTSQDDSPSSRRPEDVPSKSDGPMDITVTTRIGNGSFSESWKSKVNDIRSGCCHQEEEVKSTARTIQSRHLPSRSSTQVKQTVTMRQSTKPERCANV
ncbi:hypothetical protein B9Z55_010408 [Caenorhabditis nigoni]|uniref:Uncharacterized protein n=1 Tax=Caenorhabditis nigoni TaxID=1611254 RepID=A0A2G5UFQ3_9PELO|nr:hypothetical protein B9Z55_010408 [Caenorhabditis nigoni]